MLDRPVTDFWPSPYPPIRSFFQYWAARRGDRRCPDKAEIDPVDIPSLVPDLILYDAPDVTGSFRYRLAGARATRILGREARGMTHRELHAGGSDPAVSREVARAEREFAWIARDLRGAFRATRLLLPHREHIRIARLTLPLSDEGGSASYLVAIMIEIGEDMPFSAVHFGLDLKTMMPMRLPADVEAASGEITIGAVA